MGSKAEHQVMQIVVRADGGNGGNGGITQNDAAMRDSLHHLQQHKLLIRERGKLS